MTLGQLRRNTKLTQKEVAYKLGVLAQEVYRWEVGAYQMPYRHMDMLSKLLSIEREELIVCAYQTYMAYRDVT